MKVAFLSPPIEAAGGVGSAITGVTQALRARGVEVAIFDGHSPAAMLQGIRDFRPRVVHTHGLWRWHSRTGYKAGRMLAAPEVVSPHGMLDPWAMQNRAWKKWLAWHLYERTHCRAAAAVHALCEAEADAIRRLDPSQTIVVLPNGVDLPLSAPAAPPPWHGTFPASARVLLYLGRMHRKKGLEPLLEAWSRNRAALSAAGWRLALVGWNEGGYGDACVRRIERLQIQDTCRWFGPAGGAVKAAALALAGGFILPSFSEGLPMAVLEAWAHGLPVLMTAECNLPEGFARGAAFRITTVPAALAEQLATVLGGPGAELKLRAAGLAGRALVQEKYRWSAVAEHWERLYQSLPAAA